MKTLGSIMLMKMVWNGSIPKREILVRGKKRIGWDSTHGGPKAPLAAGGCASLLDQWWWKWWITIYKSWGLGETSHKKNRFLSGIAQITSPPSPQFGQVVQLFLDVKNDVFAHITEPSNDDYDNDVSDNCDNNFGTFNDFGVKNDQKYHKTW